MRDILSIKIFLKQLSSIYIPAFHPDSLHPHPNSPYSHPDSPRSHLDSPCFYPDYLWSHQFPHSIPWLSIPAFTDSLFLQKAHSDSFCKVACKACKYWSIFTVNQLSQILSTSIYIFYFDSVKFYDHVHTTFCEDLYNFLQFEI